MADENKSKDSEQVTVADGVNDEIISRNTNASRVDGTNNDEGSSTSVVVEESSDGVGDEDSNKGHGQQSACENAVSAYGCDRETVWTLAQMLTPGDRDRVALWLIKLDECADFEIRSQYVKFLLSVTASGSLRSEPFQQLPPVGPLRGLGEGIDPVLLLGLTLSPSACAAKPSAVQKTNGPPEARPTLEAFYARNPIPEDGTFCYAAAFSDLDRR